MKKIPNVILIKAIRISSEFDTVAFIYIDKKTGLFEVKPFSNYRFVKQSGIVDIANIDYEGLFITHDGYYTNDMEFKRV